MNVGKVIERFDELANDWLVDLKMLDDEVLQMRPAQDQWSLAEVYDHVMKVSRTYQIPNLRQSLSENAVKKRSKNLTGMAIFDLLVRKNVHMRMEEFPDRLVTLFSPVKRPKPELLADFIAFIKEVKELEPSVAGSTFRNKQYHPMFGDISTKEWYYLIEFHMWQHNKQKEKIKHFLRTGHLCISC